MVVAGCEHTAGFRLADLMMNRHCEEIWYGVEQRDIFHCMLTQELKTPLYGQHSPQLSKRPSLISWVGGVCNQFGLHICTRHLAIALVDLFMDHYIVDEEQLHLLGIGCICIAAKFEEQELDIPRAKDIVVMTSNNYSASLCMKMELTILKHFDWKIAIPTVAHFSDYFAIHIVHGQDIVNKNTLLSVDSYMFEKSQDLCKTYIDYFLDVTVQDISFRIYRPSLVASAIMVATRFVLDVIPLWPHRLQEHTGYVLEHLQAPLKLLLRTYKEARHQQQEKSSEDEFSLIATVSPGSSSTSSGYISRTPSPPFHSMCTTSEHCISA